MASESSTSGQVDDRVTNSGESVKLVEGDVVPEGKGEISKEKDGNWPFANSQPIREEQVQNAVKFLSHPKVRGSPVMYRRSFLERKGLSKEEIDEAFRRVPDPPSYESAANTIVATQADKQSLTPAVVQTHSPVQAQHPVAPPVTAPPLPVVQTSRFQWPQMLIAIGLLAATGAGTGVLFKNAAIPRLKAWIRKVMTETDESEEKKPREPSPAEEAAAAAKAAAMAAADVANASREMLKSKNEERKYFEGLVRSLEGQMEEMKSMKIALQNMDNTRHELPFANGQLEYQVGSETRRGKNNGTWRTISSIEQVDPRAASQTISKKEDGHVAVVDQSSVRPSSAPATVEPGLAPHPQSYMEVLAMLERGEKPPGIQEVNDKPPNPNQPPSNSRLKPRPKPWEVNQVQNTNVTHTAHAPHFNASSQALSEGTKLAGINEAQGNGSANLQARLTTSVRVNASDNTEPWWRRKNNEPEFKPVSRWLPESNVRITEVESGDEDPRGHMGPEVPPGNAGHSTADVSGSSSSHGLTVRGWVPPPTPPLAMPQAAVAIRHPKAKVKEELVTATEVSGSASSEQRPGPTDDQVALPGSMIQQEESQMSSSLDLCSVVENSLNGEEESNGFPSITEENSNEKPLYKEVAQEGNEESEDARTF
eukprot:Gb_00369 [translate_table: standard]